MSNLTYHGDWFLKEGRHYPGQLEINESMGKITLEIYSSETIEGYKNNIPENSAKHFQEFIFGDGFGGPFTLYHCHLAKVARIGKDFYKSAYTIEYLVHGALVNPSKGLMVRSGKFLFPGLADWYDGWKHSECLDKVEGKITNLHLSKSEILKINNDLELIFHDNIDSRIEQINFTYLISYNKSVSFKYNSDVTFRRLLKDSVVFLKLLEFSNGKPLNRLLLGLELSNTETANRSTSYSGGGDFSYYPVSNFSLSKNKEVPKHGSVSVHMIFNRDKLGSKEELDELIIRWFNHQSFANIIEYYLDSNNWFQGSENAVLSNVMFNNRFLNLIQGLEDYYRKQHYLDNDQALFKDKKSAILKMITDPLLKHWLNDTFKFTRFLGLAEKLEIIVKECLPDLIAVYGTISFDRFPKSAKDFRNKLSHGMNKDVNLGERLHLDYQIARFLLLICILKSLGMKDIKRLLNQHFYLQRDMQQIIRLQKIYSD